MIVEFQAICINLEKEAKDKEKAENLNQIYDESEEESCICRYAFNLSYPIISIDETPVKYKGVELPSIKVLTTMAMSPSLLISYDDFIGLMKQVDKNFNILAPSKIYDQDGNIISNSQ